MLLTVILILIFTFAIIFWYKHLYSPYLVLKKVGIPHNTWTPLLGNLLDIMKQSFEDFMKESKDTHVVFGFYLGARPVIIVRDTDIFKDIFVKHFNQFPVRNIEPYVFTLSRGKMSQGLIFMVEEQWRVIRPIVTPSFSAKKLKLMSSLLERICVSLQDKMNELRDSQSSVEVYNLYGKFTLEAILGAAFGAEINVLKGQGGPIVDASVFMLRQVDFNVTMIDHALMSQFPKLFKFISFTIGRWLNFEVIKSYKVLSDLAFELVRQRRASSTSQNNKDFLQLLMDAKSDDGDASKRSTLKDEEVVGLCVDFLLAGYETTKNTLAFTSYLLALNPDKQDLLYEAIDNYYQENEDASLYDGSQEIPYVEWVALESLRIHPAVNRVFRICSETVTIKGVTFPKGCMVCTPVCELHHSKEHWDQPEEFRPERFSPEGKEGRNPLCHLPFGYGIRNCIGMRFALMEVKMALIAILKENRLERSPDTQVPLKIAHGITDCPADGVHLKIVKRHN